MSAAQQRRRGCAKATIVVLAIAALALTAGGSAVAAGRLNLLNVETQFMCVSCHEPLNTVSSPQAISEKQAMSVMNPTAGFVIERFIVKNSNILP